MNFLKRIPARFRQWRKKDKLNIEKGSLREFVYLDEVSVYSLVASTLGPIPEQFTDTDTSSWQSEIGSSVGAGVGVAKAELNSQIMSNQTSGTQVIRKSIVQATFKQLYESELESLSIRPIPGDLEHPKIHNMDELLATVQTSADGYWVIDPLNLSRGKLFELEVELDADPIFRASTFTSTILEILEENADLFGLDVAGEIVQMKSVGRILEKLLAGLVPIRGKVVDYCAIELDDKEWIINRLLLQDLPSQDQPLTHPVFVVGVAEQALFWKDIRRILFSNARYRILCRMGQTGLQTTWTPVKLAHILESVIPGFSKQVDIAGIFALATTNASNQTEQAAGSKQQLMHNALVKYADLIAKHFQIKLTTKHKDEIRRLADQHSSSFGNQEVRFQAFKAISAYLSSNFHFNQDSLLFAKYRQTALADAGLDFTGGTMQSAPVNTKVSHSDFNDRFIDSEFVAIYW